MKKGTEIAKWTLGYCMFLVCLFTICTATLGLTTAIWGFVIIFTGCAIAALALWWQGERQWKNSFLTQETNSVAFAPAPQPEETNPKADPQNSQQNQDWLPLKEDDLDLLETYTQDLTERVEAVYPLVDREHIHAIVRTVMFELFCKRMAPTALATPASIITAKIERAA